MQADRRRNKRGKRRGGGGEEGADTKYTFARRQRWRPAVDPEKSSRSVHSRIAAAAVYDITYRRKLCEYICIYIYPVCSAAQSGISIVARCVIASGLQERASKMSLAREQRFFFNAATESTGNINLQRCCCCCCRWPTFFVSPAVQLCYVNFL